MLDPYHSELILLSCIQSYFVISALQMVGWRDAKRLAAYCSRKGEAIFPLFRAPIPTGLLFISFCPCHLSHQNTLKCTTVFIYLNTTFNVTDTAKPYLLEERAYLLCWLLFKHPFSSFVLIQGCRRTFFCSNRYTERPDDEYIAFVILWPVWDWTWLPEELVHQVVRADFAISFCQLCCLCTIIKHRHSFQQNYEKRSWDLYSFFFFFLLDDIPLSPLLYFPITE